MSIKTINHFFRVGIWQLGPTDVGRWAYVAIVALKKLLLAIRFFTAKRVVYDASSLTYSTLLATVPILAVVFSIARGFGYNKYIELWFLDALRSQPQAAETITSFVNSYLVHTKSGVFFGFGFVFMLYAVLILVRHIEVTFNGIWQVKKPRSIFRTFTDYMAMLFLLPVVLVFTSAISLFVATAAKSVPELLVLGPSVRFLVGLAPYAVMSAMFVGLYVFMPNTHVRIRSAIVPGILAGTAMQWLQLVYIHSQIWVSSYNAIYGSFAALPLFMLWVQISWIICLFGAELCYTTQNLDYFDYNMQTSDVSHRYRLMLCAMLMGRVCKRFDEGGRPYTAQDLRAATGIPIRIVNDLLYDLVQSRLLVEVGDDEKGASTRYMPAQSLDHLSAGVMIARLESHGRWKLRLPLSGQMGEQWGKVLEARSAYLANMRDVLLKDL